MEIEQLQQTVSTCESYIKRFSQGSLSDEKDIIAVESPLEIQIRAGEVSEKVSVTMRTPENDTELALGFLFTEGILDSYQQVGDVFFPEENVVVVVLKDGVEPQLSKAGRNFLATSSCGVCGKSSKEDILQEPAYEIKFDGYLNSTKLTSLGENFRTRQSVFLSTGGIHAAAIFDSEYQMVSLREDVGRHNALDKILGFAFMQDQIPMKNKILFLSGRASFELVQKASMAGIPVIVSVGAPSSLAVELARENGQTLIGFLKKDSFNIYAGQLIMNS